MSTRFTDDLFNNTEGSDFIVRNRRPLAVQIFIVFLIAFVAIYFTASFMNNSSGNKVLFFATLAVVIGSLGWFTLVFAANLRDLVMATEFQNAMLASATQLSTRFCLIAKRDGSIVYIDPGFQKLFPQFLHGDGRSIGGLFVNAGISDEIIKKIMMVLESNKNDRVMLSLKDAEGNDTPLMITIDLLPRPKGYFLFRGRDFVEKRNTPKADGDTASALLLSQALYVLPEGVLIAKADGMVSYANHALEEWLGYGAGEIVAQGLTLEQVCRQYAGSDAGKPVLGDFSGEVVLQRKNREPLTMQIQQRLLRENGQPVGISAIISNDGVKKN